MGPADILDSLPIRCGFDNKVGESGYNMQMTRELVGHKTFRLAQPQQVNPDFHAIILS